MRDSFQCFQCGETKTPEKDSISTGYGVTKTGDKLCFACCGINDAKELVELKIGEKLTLYLDTKAQTISNGPGTFKIQLHHIKRGNHNMARVRYDFWFKHDKYFYHGTTFGDGTQIAHIKKLKDVSL